MGPRTLFRRALILNPSTSKARIEIGANCFFNNYCSLNCHDSISIGNGSTFGEGVRFYDHDHDFRKQMGEGQEPFVTAPITVGNNVWVGSNVLILKGVSIGDGSVIGAGTIVNHDVPPNSIVYDKRNFTVRNLA